MRNQSDGDVSIKRIWDDKRLLSPHSQQDKSRRVQRMFDAIAPTYERVNTIASLGRDGLWRREMVRLAKVRPDDVLLDVACGTGDVVRAFATAPAVPERIVGLDFSWQMLGLADRRPVRGGLFIQGDALKLPLADGSVTLVTCAFGVRNFQNLSVGLKEMWRVLRAGGRAVIMDFSVPRLSWIRKLYLFYFNRLMPRLATLISRDSTGAYRYLPRSVLSFPSSEVIRTSLQEAGFAQVEVCSRTLGIVSIYVALKSGT